jgi:RNA polymerase sigma-70 factor (ECF subfamily)
VAEPMTRPVEPLTPARRVPDARTGARPSADDADRLLAERAIAGDVGAFDALVTGYADRVFGVAYRILGDRAEAEDLAQEVFVALYHSLKTFRGESRLSTWIYRITKNRCLNRLKFLKRRRFGTNADVDDPALRERLVDPATDERGQKTADRVLEGRDTAAFVQRFLDELPDEQRTLVVLRDIEDLSYEEIVEITGLPLGTVKSRLHRARAALAVLLTPHLDDMPRVLAGSTS